MRSYGLVSKNALALSAAALLCGCQTLETKNNTPDFENQFSQGSYQAAAETALSAGKIDQDGSSNSLLWSLQAGASLSANGDFKHSNTVFDGAETLMKKEDTENIAKKGFEKATAVLLNNSFNAYSPAVYDGVMVNTYKARNCILLNDMQDARIEFNRAADRQRRAEEHFKEKIKEQEEKLAKQKLDNKSQNRQQTKSASARMGLNYDKSVTESQKTIYESYPELESWKVYPDFVNPYTDYLHGLYFLLGSQDKSDLGKSRESLRRVAGMVPKNKAVATDLKVANNLRKGNWRKHKLNPAVWVIFENGQAPVVKENLIPLPLFLINDKIDYAQIALPKLEPRHRAYSFIDIYNGKKKLGRTEHLASIDRVVQTEFKKELPYKVTEAVISTMTKALIQYKVQEKAGVFGSIASIAYQAATTHADTRSWTSLPKEIQVARLRKPKNGTLELRAPELSTPIAIQLPETRFSVVFVKATSATGAPVFNVVGFDA
ncbi:MAG: hypothetical protein KC477_08245 [Oceanospirillaceae bacterium]|nr:hypothetical protein [Oceanospirillaceae bacterium]